MIGLKDLSEEMKEGALTKVPVGYFRNYLLPRGLAKVASPEILE